MGRKSFYILLLNILIINSVAQTGGDNVYEFLNLTHSGLISSLGGTNVSLYTDNLNTTYHNPALLTSAMNKTLALNFVNYFAGINYGLVMYSLSYPDIGNFAAGITYLNYGSFTEADPSGVITGSFHASEYAFSFLYSRGFYDNFSAGINFKPVLSHLEKYTSFGFVFDIGGNYHSEAGLFSAGFVIRNLGVQVTTYAGEERLSPPFEIQAGITKELAHSPFRFSLALRHLQKFDLTHIYDDPGDSRQNSGFLENMMRHAIIGVEMIPHRNFYISAGYNYQRRRELRIESKSSAVGFSWGFGINTSFMNIEFGRATYHLAGSSNHVSMIVKTDKVYNKIWTKN
ncbi:MAG TPA: hypothetical protein DDW27_19845 [Bacteroidales bacterium]|nr:hypothetical protein [Bacteroidales bacterium]